MKRKPTMKTTIRHKKNRKGEVVATLIRHAEPATEAAKPEPQNVADAWDAMKAAHDAPMWIRHQTVNPYRAEQDKRDLLAKLPLVNTSREYVNEQAYDPTRRVAPDVHQTQEPIIPLTPLWNYNNCTHRHTPGDVLGSAIAWMEHSQGIVTGVCAHCPTQFDCRHEEHMELLRANPRAIRSMGHAGQYDAPGSEVGQVYGTPWQIFVYNHFHFAWVYSVKVWLRNFPALLRKAWAWAKEDF